MSVACSHGLRAARDHLHETGSFYFRPVPKLARSVVARGPHSAILLQDQAVQGTCSHGPRTGREHLHKSKEGRLRTRVSARVKKS